MKHFVLATALLLTATAFADVFVDQINPDGEHDHLIGTVSVQPTGKKIYPTVNENRDLFIIRWSTAKGGQSASVAAPEFEPNITPVSAFEKSPSISWEFACPTSNQSCACGNGYNYSSFAVGSFSATAQDYHVTIPTGRIDVNDMHVRRQNGSAYYAKGTYTVQFEFSANQGSCTLIANANTRTGLDVPRGYKYTITTTATSEEGSTLKDTKTLDLR